MATARPNGNESGLSHVTSPTQIQKVSLVKLAPLEKTNASKTSRKLWENLLKLGDSSY